MENKNILTKILAILGTLLVWLPVLAPLFFAVASTFGGEGFRFDYLMPAEHFLLVLAGGLLLLWAALRRRTRRGLVGWGLGSAVLLPVLGSVAAKLTGLADGRTEPGGWEWALVLGFIIAYILAVVVVGVGGILLLRDLFMPKPPASVAPGKGV